MSTLIPLDHQKYSKKQIIILVGTISDFKASFRRIILKTHFLQQKQIIGSMQWKGIPHLSIHSYSHMTFDKDVKNAQGRDDIIPQKWSYKNWMYTCRKMIATFITLHIKSKKNV